MEEWRPIKGYEGYYEVSNKGNVRSLDRVISYSDGHFQSIKGRIMTPNKTKWGYLQIRLSKDSSTKRRHIHDLVAEAYIPNPENLSEVNHKDHNKLNNLVENLEWITHKDNMVDMGKYLRMRNGTITRITCPICGKKKTENSVLCNSCRITERRKSRPTKELLDEYVKDGLNYSDIGRIYGVSGSCVKKWVSACGSSRPYICQREKPKRQELIDALNTYAKNEIAALYQVHVATVAAWTESYNISITKETQIVCVETNEVFNSIKEAYRKIHPDASWETFRDNITRSSKNGKRYYGYTWKVIKTQKIT